MQSGVGEIGVGVHGSVGGLEGTEVLALVLGDLDLLSGEVDFQYPHLAWCNVVCWRGDNTVE